jgi:hypothetical protein
VKAKHVSCEGLGTGKPEGVILIRKKANTDGGSDLYINKEKLHGRFENPNTPCKKIFTS